MQELSTACTDVCVDMAEVVEVFFYGTFAFNVFDRDGLVVSLALLKLCHSVCSSGCLSPVYGEACAMLLPILQLCNIVLLAVCACRRCYSSSPETRIRRI